MKRKVVIDSGPLVALFNKSDIYFQKALHFIKNFDGILFSNVSVMTEVFYLLDFNVEAQLSFLEWIRDGAIIIVDLHIEDMDRIIELIKKYRDLPIDFADASLIIICERLQIYDVATFDSDFYIYRMKKKKYFNNVFGEMND